MNRNDLAAEVATHAKLTRADAARAVELVFTTIAEALQKGEEVKIVGFGTFTAFDRAASEGRNPKTGEPIQIPASRQPRFRAGKSLKDALNAS